MRIINRFISPLKNKVRYTPFLRRIMMRIMINMDFPSVIGVDPTNRCNLSCTFCGPRRMKGEKGVMEWPLYKRLIDECKHRNKLWMLILHNFGEPLLNTDIVRMVALAKEEQVARSVQFSTNGTLLTEDIAVGLIKAGLDGLALSVDAYTNEEYKELKGRDLLAKLIENAKMIMRIKRELKSKVPYVTAKMVRRKGFEHTSRPFLKLWSGIVDQAALTPYSNWGNMVDYRGREIIPSDRYACHFLWYYPVINWDGRVFFCCAACDDTAVIGNINNSSMEKIWTGDKLRELRHCHLEKRYHHIPVCAKCTYWGESRVNLDAALRRLKEY